MVYEENKLFSGTFPYSKLPINYGISIAFASNPDFSPDKSCTWTQVIKYSNISYYVIQYCYHDIVTS